MEVINNPRLFGINKSNRDFTNADTWGKNQFNSSFPASLSCYMHSKGLNAVYLKTNSDMSKNVASISFDNLFGIDPLCDNIFFSFETQFSPFQKYIIGQIPRNDLVIHDISNNTCVSSFEIKLTALPDNSTCNLNENQFGSEIVVRPDTIIYLACSIIEMFQGDKESIKEIIGDKCDSILDWTQAKNVIPYIPEIISTIKKIVNAKYEYLTPFIIQPIWKTNGKAPQLSNNCLDIFVWSNLGALNLFMPADSSDILSISRHTRSMIWLFKMLLDYSINGQFNGAKIIDELSFNTKNDKAFSSNGLRTHKLMDCPELLRPRVRKEEIKNIILGGGQNLLSPERRFDAIIYNSPDLFVEESN